MNMLARKKVLIVDLDNTLWKGIIGEEVVEVTRPFRDFQEAILDLKDSGILLTIASKNDEIHAIKTLDTLDGMLLSSADFITFRINWDPKPQSIESIAAELNLGLDSFIFFDDSQYEREMMRELLPEVETLEVAAPEKYARILTSYEGFQADRLTSEDLYRTELYRAEQARKTAQTSTSDVDSFLKSLDMRARIFRPHKGYQLDRVLQLINKTNQFNVTVMRRTREQLQEMYDHPYWDVYAISLRDKWGDSGIVGAVVLNGNLVDNFVLSCRVIGRTLEYAILSWLVQHRGRPMNFVLAKSTDRNGPAMKFLETLKFGQIPESYVTLEAE